MGYPAPTMVIALAAFAATGSVVAQHVIVIAKPALKATPITATARAPQ